MSAKKAKIPDGTGEAIPENDPRAALAKALSTWMSAEQVQSLINEVLSLTKRVNHELTCKECGQRQKQWVEVPDAKAVTDSLVNLSNQAFGRPGEASGEDQQIIFKRLTKLEE